MKLLLIANDLNPYLLFLNLFQRAKGSTYVVAPVQTCFKVEKLDTFFVSDCEWSQPLPLVHVLVLVGQRVNICSRSCSDLLQGNKLNTFFVSDCEWSQPLPKGQHLKSHVYILNDLCLAATRDYMARSQIFLGARTQNPGTCL
jgi:hypothetical protein